MATDLKLQVQLGLTDKLLGPLKRVQRGAGDVGKALAETRDQLQKLKQIDNFQKQQAAIQATAGKLNEAQERVRQLREQMRTLGDQASKKLKDDFRKANEAVRDMTTRVQSQRTELGKYRERLKSAGIGTQELRTSQGDLKAKFEQTTLAMEEQKQKLKQIGDLQKRSEALNAAHGKSMAHAAMIGGGGYAMLSAGRSATNGLMGPVRAYADFEDAMAGVAKQVEGARDANGQLTPTYYQMADAIKGMAERIPMATTEIAALVEGGARMGIQGKANLLAFAEVAANAATAFELPADELGENLARIADLYKLPIKNVGALGDAINYLDDNAKSKGADIIDVLQRTAGITASVGMSYKDAAALGSTFLTLGSSAEVAGTATNAMIRELAIATEQPKRFQKGLAALGLDAKAVQKGMARDATATIQQVLDGINSLPKDNQLTVATQLFGKEFGDDASKLAANIAEYRRQLELANSAAGQGSMQKEADIKAQLLSARWLMTQSKLFNALAEAGETLKPVLIDLMNGVSGLLGSLRDWVKANPALAGGILKTAVGLTVLATVLGGAAIALAGFMAPFSLLNFTMAKLLLNSAGTTRSMAQLFPTFVKMGNGLRAMLPTALGLAKNALPMLATGVRMLGAALIGTPLGWFLLAITAIAGSAYLIYKNWDLIGPYFQGLWAEIKQGFSGGLGGIAATILNFSPLGLFYRAFAGVLNYFGAEMPARFTDFGGMLIDGLVNGITNSLGRVKGAITGAGASTIGWFKEKLGIRSPSRVFAELGGFTMQGLAQGLTGGEGGPLQALTGIGKRLTQAGALALSTTVGSGAIAMDNRPPLSAGNGSQAVASAAPNVTIHVHPSAGMDEQGLARLVAAEVAKIQQRSHVRARSSLSDQE